MVFGIGECPYRGKCVNFGGDECLSSLFTNPLSYVNCGARVLPFEVKRKRRPLVRAWRNFCAAQVKKERKIRDLVTEAYFSGDFEVVIPDPRRSGW